MHVRYRHQSNQREVEVQVLDPHALVADLAAALEPAAPGRPLSVDGRPVPAGCLVSRAGIQPGSMLEPGPQEGAPPAPTATPAVVAVRVLGGPDAGAVRHLAPGVHVLGRGDGAHVVVDDPTVSARHLELAVDADGSVAIRDLGSANGTWCGALPVRGPRPLPVDEVVSCGATQVAVGPPGGGAAQAAQPVRSGPRPFNRPPRARRRAEPEPIAAPTAPEESSAVTPVGVVGVLVPVVLGLVMVRVLHSWTYALFMLMSPVLLIGSAIESRRRGRRVHRRARRRYRSDVEAFTRSLGRAADGERQRLADRLPDLPTVIGRAESGDGLWERRLDHEDALVARLGLGPVGWTPPVPGEPRHHPPEVRDVLREHATLDAAPVEVALGAGDVVGITGDRPAAVAIARSLLVQVAIHQGPADVRIGVLAASRSVPEWDWAKWLPHTIDGRGGHLLAGRTDDAQALLGDLAAEPRPESGPVLVLVVDDPALLDGPRAPARAAAAGALGPVCLLVVASDPAALPASCSAVVTVDRDGGAELHDPATARATGGVRAAGLPEHRARRVARALARFEDPDAGDLGAALPPTIGLRALLGADHVSSAGLAARWRAAGTDPALRAPLGATADGPLLVDLCADGPHALVAGTTGAGKSELLRAWVAGLAAVASPDHLTFLLIDFKGGSAFDACARLPHTVGLVTDLDAHLAARALRCLEAELRHREQVLRTAGALDLTAYRATGSATPLPRLVVVIDEFATLATELPDFVDALLGVAQRGRSLGVHLVLATQRPAGAVSETIRANTNLRIALRVQDAHDSRDVLDVPDAALLPRARPGRALVRLGPGRVVPLQVAQVSEGSAGDPGPVVVRPFDFGRGADRSRTGATAAGPSDLERLVEAAGEAFRSGAWAAPRQPWPPALPATSTSPRWRPTPRVAPTAGRSASPVPTSRTSSASAPRGGTPTRETCSWWASPAPGPRRRSARWCSRPPPRPGRRPSTSTCSTSAQAASPRWRRCPTSGR